MAPQLPASLGKVSVQMAIHGRRENWDMGDR